MMIAYEENNSNIVALEGWQRQHKSLHEGGGEKNQLLRCIHVRGAFEQASSYGQQGLKAITQEENRSIGSAQEPEIVESCYL